VLIDFSQYAVGDHIILTNQRGRGGTAKVMRFVVARSGTDDSQVPPSLVPFHRLQPSDAAVRRDLVFARGGAQAHGMTLWTINGEPFHIHLAPFQVLSIGGDDPGPYNQGWKDTVNLDNGDYAELLVHFDGYRGKYVFHCHNLEHEDMQMMGNFQVT
jgi:Multicopper oxidase